MMISNIGSRNINIYFLKQFADVAELVDAPGLGPGDSHRGGSSPFIRTKIQESEEVIGLEQCFKAHYEGHYNTEPELLNRHRQAVSSAEPSYDEGTCMFAR